MAYTRRQRWESELQAVEIGKVLAVMLGGSTDREPERVPADVLLASMGVKVE